MGDPGLIQHLGIGSDAFPRELAEIEAPPEELWLRGRRELMCKRPRVAVVGSRAPTPYGEAQARRFALALAERDVVVVSGLARGVDQAAHRAALDAGGDTIAVLGSGVDRPWPEGELAEEIAERGLLLSEHPPGTPPRPHHFPARNRILSGLARGVLVVEAAAASGSLITARWAIDQGREVFALPGRVDHPMSRGCHRLLREGAWLVESPEELCAALGLADGARTDCEDPPAPRSPLLERLRGETLSADELARGLEREVGGVLAELVALELSGHVVRAAGGLYRLPVRGR